APALVRRPRDDRVVDCGVALQRLLHLLGEDLCAAGVDRHRVTAEDPDRAVGTELPAVARHRVAYAADHGVRALGLRLVTEVPERYTAAARHPPRLGLVRRETAGHFGVEHDRVLVHLEGLRDLAAGGRDRGALRARLGGSEPVED